MEDSVPLAELSLGLDRDVNGGLLLDESEGLEGILISFLVLSQFLIGGRAKHDVKQQEHKVLVSCGTFFAVQVIEMLWLLSLPVACFAHTIPSRLRLPHCPSQLSLVAFQ